MQISVHCLICIDNKLLDLVIHIDTYTSAYSAVVAVKPRNFAGDK